MYNKLKAVITESGLWDGARETSHAFLLSPSVYHITEVQKEELTRLGHALYDCLLGLSQIAVIAYDARLNYGDAWRMVRKVFSTGVPKVYQELQGMNVRHIPRLLKVDLMVDQEGNFKIAEIDGHNKHGLGYSTLALRFRNALYPDKKALPGVVRTLAGEVARLGHTSLKLLYADQEQFYVPEFEIARQEFAKYGVECRVVSEMRANVEFLKKGLFLDLPFLYHRGGLYETIIPAYKSGVVEFVIPPKPFLGAKGILALLRNDGGDEHLEAVLHSFIKKGPLEFVRRFIPETILVGKQARGIESIRERIARKRYVLKESISSGMKGTVFSDDGDFNTTLERACASQMNWTLQEEVTNHPHTFSYYESGDDPRLKTTSDWFVRVTVQYVSHQLADAVVTARRHKAVHGGKDCIQIGTVVL